MIRFEVWKIDLVKRSMQIGTHPKVLFYSTPPLAHEFEIAWNVLHILFRMFQRLAPFHVEILPRARENVCVGIALCKLLNPLDVSFDGAKCEQDHNMGV